MPDILLATTVVPWNVRTAVALPEQAVEAVRVPYEVGRVAARVANPMLWQGDTVGALGPAWTCLAKIGRADLGDWPTEVDRTLCR